VSWSSPARSLRFLALVLVVGLASACASGSRRGAPPGTSEPDKFLFDKGTEALNQKKWLTAREYFKQVVETYTSSPFRPDAKLGLADTYLGEGTSESIVLAINEYREFLSYYPTNHRADYAQYKIGLCHAHQMRAAQRDQTETRDAIKEFETFVERYPNSTLMPDVKAKMREAGLDHIPLVVGGIISPDDELVLKNMGVSAVYTPKDYVIDTIMIGICKVVERSSDKTNRTAGAAKGKDEAAQVY